MQVNFISEVMGFHRLTKTRRISNKAQLLWFNLFLLWNEAGFPDWLQVDVMRMMAMLQVNSKSTVIRARDELINAGLLVLKPGGNRQPNKYQFTLLSEQSLRGTQKQSKSKPETGRETGCETSPLYKQNQTKQKLQKEKSAFGEFGNVYLTAEELKKLQTDYPDNWEQWIHRLDMGKEVKGYIYASDYAAIRNWMENEEREERDIAFQELMNDWI